ncbi:MAG: pilus assembly PilX N-terminal domain-containing protein [Desulfobacterales bacterium]|jgi:Tfp pilus assembly protein PilX
MDMGNSLKRTIDNENGFVLVASILVSAIVLLTGVLAIWTSNTEVKIVRNESQMIREFYSAEAGVIDVLENYNSGPTHWMTNDFLTAAPTDASSMVNSSDEAGNVVATVEVRCIESSATPVSGLSNSANNIPQQAHIGPPPEGSGYSLKYFEVRRYGITATSTNGNTQIQVGAWKVFNKF